MEEAVVKIALQDAGGAGATSAASTSASTRAASGASSASTGLTPTQSAARSSIPQTVAIVPTQFRLVTGYLKELVDIRKSLTTLAVNSRQSRTERLGKVAGGVISTATHAITSAAAILSAAATVATAAIASVAATTAAVAVAANAATSIVGTAASTTAGVVKSVADIFKGTGSKKCEAGDNQYLEDLVELVQEIVGHLKERKIPSLQEIKLLEGLIAPELLEIPRRLAVLDNLDTLEQLIPPDRKDLKDLALTESLEFEKSNVAKLAEEVVKALMSDKSMLEPMDVEQRAAVAGLQRIEPEPLLPVSKRNPLDMMYADAAASPELGRIPQPSTSLHIPPLPVTELHQQPPPIPWPATESEPEHELLLDQPATPDYQEYEPLPTTGPDQSSPNEVASDIPPFEPEDFGIDVEEIKPRHPEWEGWVQPHHPRGWNFPKMDENRAGPGLTLAQLKQMEEVGAIPAPAYDSSGDPVYRTVSTPQYKRFLELLEEKGLPPPGFARGGWVGDHPGTPQGTDTIPAWLTRDEFVVPANVAAANRPALEGMMGGAQHMAGGGQVKPHADTRWVKPGTVIGDVIRHGANPSDDPSETISGLGEAVSGVGQKMAMVAPVFGAITTAVGDTTQAFGSLMKSINSTAERYGQYSPEIASAQAVAEVKQTMGDIRRAQEGGSELASYVQAQADLQQKFEDAKMKVLTAVLPIITRIVELVEIILPSGQGIENAIRALLTPLMAIPGIGERIARAMHDELRPPVEDPTSMLDNPRFGEVGDMGRRGWVPDA